MESHLRLGLIADDLTGTLDTGVQFTRKGFFTLFPFKFSRSFEEIPVLALNSNTRHASGQTAYRSVKELCKRLKGRILYKKIDSTLRGNVGREIVAMLDGSGLAKALLAPAFPTQGRTVEEGILKFYGVPFHLTFYRDEFPVPPETSFIPDLVRGDLGERIAHISREGFVGGPRMVAEKVLEAEERIVLVDTYELADLRIIALAWWNFLKEKVLACGSAGLANELDLEIPAGTQHGGRESRKSGPVLLVCGSRHEKTLNQLRRVIDSYGLPVIEPNMKRFVDPENSSREIRRVAKEISMAQNGRSGIVLTTSFQDILSGKATMIARNLGKTVAQVLKTRRFSNLIVSGGDVAMETCSRLRSSAMKIESEIVQGAPLSFLTDGPYKGLAIVTKGGGLGEPDAFIKVIQYLAKEGE